MNINRTAVSAELSLRRTYRIVPAGEESGFMDFDDELSELLSQALLCPP